MPLYPSTLALFPAAVFVETGTYSGEGVHVAKLNGFKEIHTVELDPHRIPGLTAKFAHMPEVTLHHGNSGELLPAVISSIKTKGPIVFWLDAHPGGALTLDNCPVMAELNAIEQALPDIQVAAVLIDDMRLFSADDQKTLERRLQGLFPSGTVKRVPGIEDNDILSLT